MKIKNKPNKKKILFLVNIDSFFVSHRLPIAEKLLKKVLMYILLQNFQLLKKLNSLGFKTHQINFNRNSYNILKALISLIQILKLFKNIKPDITHLISIKPVIFGGILSFFSPVKSMVISITGLGSMFIKKGIIYKIRENIFNIIYRIIFLFPNLKVILQNKDDLDYFVNKCNLSKKKVVIIKGSGVNLNKFKFSSIPKSNPIIMMISRIIEDKGIFEFVESAKKLKKKNFNGEFYLIGDIDNENPSAISKTLIKKWKKEKNLKIFNYKNNIYQFIKKSTIIVLPSYREGFPKVIMEASACGRPVITSNVPGCREAIKNKITGILVPVKDSTILSNTILKLSKNRNILNKMGKAGRIYAEKNFNINNIVSKHLNIYKKM